MTVAAVKPYRFPAQDTVDKFPAPLLYIGWDHHMMFAAPFCLPRSEERRVGKECRL